ncbi:MAG: heparinase, partial [Spirochaetia bacterium]|nr:heparinase [Spirochaetia bacterium]
QHQGGTPWSTFNGKPYSEYNKIHMTNVWLGSSICASTAVFEAAYVDSLKLKQMQRHLIMIGGKYLFVLDSMKSDDPHQYEWRLHSDKEAKEISKNKFSMENGNARLVIQNLLPVEKSSIDPTIVETELYDMTRSRPQQRGFHISLVSPKQKDYQFLTAMSTQNSPNKADAFSAAKTGENKIEALEGGEKCTAWIGSGKELAGTFAYILSDSKGIKSLGLSGKSLTTDTGAFILKNEGQVILRRSAAGEWEAENTVRQPNEITIEIKGQGIKKLSLK